MSEPRPTAWVGMQPTFTRLKALHKANLRYLVKITYWHHISCSVAVLYKETLFLFMFVWSANQTVMKCFSMIIQH